MAVSEAIPRGHRQVRYFAAIGEDALAWVEGLARDAGLRRVPTPRAASLLLIAGRLPERSWPALRRVHDQMPHPRAVLHWGEGAQPVPDAVALAPAATPAVAMRALQGDLDRGARGSSPDLLPNEPPAPWLGKGPHGQGGEGMMGGTPYGRPMTMRGDELRDGLRLDAHAVTLGPFAPMLPPGLALDLRLQGDVIQRVEVMQPPFRDAMVEAPFAAAIDRPMSAAGLERARAVHHLRCLGRFCALRGAAAPAARAYASAYRATIGGRVDLGSLRRWLWLSGLRPGIAPGLGTLSAAQRGCLSGPALRAAGVPDDLRTRLEPYTGVGFAPIARQAGDVRARIDQWLAEAAQALDLAARLEGLPPTTFAEGLEGPAGALGAPAGGDRGDRPALDLDALLRGLEWGQAVSVLASFSPDALRRMLGAAG
ncbi:MAG: hypothetical protein LJE69_10450 [Thiohalocapsa sp.]|nr:hypothetical protein [Thiohalocapsa sp.]